MRQSLPVALVIAAGLMLNACAAFTNHNAPEKIGVAQAASNGFVVLSTGAASRCFNVATQLNIAPVGHPRWQDVVASVQVDNFSIKSDFGDHQGNVSVLSLPAGDYEIYPSVLNPLYVPERVSYAQFRVNAGEAVYIGEYYLTMACGTNTRAAFSNQAERDLGLVRQKNPSFAAVTFQTRIAHSSGYICDTSAGSRCCTQPPGGLAALLIESTIDTCADHKELDAPRSTPKADPGTSHE